MSEKHESRTTILFQELNEISQGHQSYNNYLNNRKNEVIYHSLKEYIDDYLYHHPDITIPDIIRDSNLSKNYVYPICSGKKNPSKYKLIAFCIGAHMNLKETQRALTLAGCSELYPKIPVDSGIIICINQGYNNVANVDLFLDAHGLESPF